jgi:hypothetical protein
LEKLTARISHPIQDYYIVQKESSQAAVSGGQKRVHIDKSMECLRELLENAETLLKTATPEYDEAIAERRLAYADLLGEGGQPSEKAELAKAVEEGQAQIAQLVEITVAELEKNEQVCTPARCLQRWRLVPDVRPGVPQRRKGSSSPCGTGSHV